jgi:hypothetical protein
MIDEFTAAVRGAIERKAPFDERLALLREYRDRGLTAKAAADALKQMSQGTEENIENQIFDLLDIATGWCAPNWRVWPTSGKTES